MRWCREKMTDTGAAQCEVDGSWKNENACTEELGSEAGPPGMDEAEKDLVNSRLTVGKQTNEVHAENKMK